MEREDDDDELLLQQPDACVHLEYLVLHVGLKADAPVAVSARKAKVLNLIDEMKRNELGLVALGVGR